MSAPRTMAWSERLANAVPGWTQEEHAHDLGVEAALDTYYGDDGELARTRSLADLASDAMLAAQQDGIPADLLRDYVVAYVGAVAWWIAEPAASRA